MRALVMITVRRVPSSRSRNSVAWADSRSRAARIGQEDSQGRTPSLLRQGLSTSPQKRPTASPALRPAMRSACGFR